MSGELWLVRGLSNRVFQEIKQAAARIGCGGTEVVDPGFCYCRQFDRRDAELQFGVNDSVDSGSDQRCESL